MCLAIFVACASYDHGLVTEDAENVSAIEPTLTIEQTPSPESELIPESELEIEAIVALESEIAPISDDTDIDDIEINDVEIDNIDMLISQMSIYEKIGQLFIVRMPTPQYAQRLINDYHIGGFILFSSDVQSIEQVQRLTSALQETAQHNSNPPLFMAVDEEGGRVSRIGRLFPERSPSAYNLGQTGDPQNAYEAYYTIGQRLRYLGFNMNFAPVADIWSNPANTVIGDRAFGREPEIVASMVEAAVHGLHSAGIIAVVKHFPGHGDTLEDSHYNMAFFNHDIERFDSVEAIPFQAGIAAGTEGIMMGHITTPYISPEIRNNANLPATFCPYFMEQILREEMGFDGLIITDALDMGALTNYFSQDEIVLEAFLNGADILLMPSNPSVAIKTMVDAFQNGVFTEERLHQSLRRILYFKMRNSP